MNEEDLETESYDEPQEDLFAGESIIAAANKVIDFDEFQWEQEQKLQKYNDQLVNDAETIKYVDNINLEVVIDHKNLKITAKKISHKYRKLRKRKAAVSVPKLKTINYFYSNKQEKWKTSRQSCKENIEKIQKYLWKKRILKQQKEHFKN